MKLKNKTNNKIQDKKTKQIIKYKNKNQNNLLF